MKLDANDKRHLQAAEGWLELGDWQSANDEIDELAVPLQVHRDVLTMRYRIYTKAKKWKKLAEVANSLAQMRPCTIGLELLVLLNHLKNNKPKNTEREGLFGAFAAFRELNKQYKIKPYNSVIVQGVLERLEDSSIPLDSIVEWVASMSPMK